MQSDLFVRSDTGEVVTHEYRKAIVDLLKILYQLQIISKKQEIDISTKFQALFV